MERRRNLGQRAGLTRNRVIMAAYELLTERGLEALTMRSLAQRLDVTPNALYTHVPSKTALIDGVLDNVLTQVEAPTPDIGDPIIGLHDLMSSTYRVLLAHSDLVPLYLARQGARGANAQHLGEIMLRLLSKAGVSGAQAREALRVLIVYTIGFAAFTSHSPIATTDSPQPREKELRSNFDSGLRWLLKGIATPAR